MTFATGQRVTVRNPGNLPCEAGDSGTVSAVRIAAREFPVGVTLDGGRGVEWFAVDEIVAAEEQA